MTVEEAVEIVARNVLQMAAEDIEWADYPEIGEHDWDRVRARVNQLANPDVYPGPFGQAYALLKSRAEDDPS